MAQECDDAARKVDRAKSHLRWCIESGESEWGLRGAQQRLTIADEEFDQAVAASTITQREAFITATQVTHGPSVIRDDRKNIENRVDAVRLGKAV